MNRPRLIMIGLDGVGLDLAQDLAGRGIMPHLGRLMRAGRAWPTASPLPEVSPVCWTSMFSGQDPGGHGIFGFGEYDLARGGVRPVDSTQVRAERLWERLSRLGRRSVVLNVPLTFPAREINGVMVSGFVTPDLKRGVRPSSLLSELEEMGYRPEADLDQGITDVSAMMKDLRATLQIRLKLFEKFLDEDWDLYVAVITETDRVNHFVWPALSDPAHPMAHDALTVYKMVDDFLGLVWAKKGPDIQEGRMNLLVAADHSFGPIQAEFYVNRWLVENGYLTVQGEPGVEKILPQTVALALDPGRIYLHLKGRFPDARLEPGPQAQALAGEIRARLLNAAYADFSVNAGSLPQKPLHPAKEVRYGRELYHGPYVGQGPDLVAVGAPGFSLRAGLGKPRVFGRSHLTGTHRAQGALALWVGEGPGQVTPSEVRGLYGLMARGLGLSPDIS